MKKIRTFLLNLSKKNKLIRNMLRKIQFILLKTKYSLNSLGKKINDKQIVFACFDGKSYTCSPKALYEYMLSDKNFDEYTFIWAFTNKENYKFLESNKNTKLIDINSKEFTNSLITSKYWIINYKIDDFIKPKKEQVLVQCWHGTPLKRLGCDLLHYDNSLNTVEEMKKRYKLESSKISYFISPSEYASKVFRSAWNLDEIHKEDIIVEEGYPRNDFILNYNSKDITKIKKEILGSTYEENKDKKIILYAPTYRANQHESGLGYTYKEEVDFERLRKEFGKDYIILFRPHYFIANVFDFKKYEGFVYDVSKIDDINLTYVISDMLITDYSSVFFDYANLKRPIIFYMYDLEYYRDKSNGFYFDIEKELPGPIVTTESDLIKSIKETKKFKFDKKYEEFNKKFNYLDDGNASKRVVYKIFNLNQKTK